MKKIIYICLAIVFSRSVHPCQNLELFEFGQYSQTMTKSEKGVSWTESHGEAVKKTDTEVSINLSFLDELAKSPDGQTLEKNREELLYLIASGNKKATVIGLQVLDTLINEPIYAMECETKYELYGKDEIAFSLGRSSKVYAALCQLESDQLIPILDYYEKQPKLWGLKYDPPWLSQNLACHPLNKPIVKEVDKVKSDRQSRISNND